MRPLKLSKGWLQLKYLVLTVVIIAALLKISWVFLVAPIALATRFYALVLAPIAHLGADSFFQGIQPLADLLNWPQLAYAHTAVPRFARQWFPLLCMLAIVASGFWLPRFWCRSLCPAGAIFALLSHFALFRRTVSDKACTHCQKCQQNCPMGAIGDIPLHTDQAECIVCETCVRVCPTEAISFNVRQRAGPSTNRMATPSRRAFILAGIAGVTSTAIVKTGLAIAPQKSGPGYPATDRLIRPPGALPEVNFLTRCVRCGACMAICPTNTLQPMGMSAGLAAFYSPIITPRRGACEPLCNLCGQTCPTQAIRPVEIAEKIWVKLGTAAILRHKCLAWEHQKKCLVCDEVCPYNAIELKTVADQSVAVPFVIEEKCAGCGYCHHHCPVQNQSAIVVLPMDALRLRSGSYRQVAQQRGLALQLTPKSGDSAQPTIEAPDHPDAHNRIKRPPDGATLPPGFSR